LVMGLGIVATSVIVLLHIGWGSLINDLYAAWESGRTKVHPFNPFHASSYGWGYLIWQFVFQIAAMTTWQTQISRVLAAKDAETGKRMYRRTSFYFVGRFLLPALWGAAACVWFTQHGGLPKDLT